MESGCGGVLGKKWEQVKLQLNSTWRHWMNLFILKLESGLGPFLDVLLLPGVKMFVFHLPLHALVDLHFPLLCKMIK